MESHSTQIHMKSQNSLIKQRIKKRSKPTNQNPKPHLSNKEKIEDEITSKMAGVSDNR